AAPLLLPLRERDLRAAAHGLLRALRAEPALARAHALRQARPLRRLAGAPARRRRARPLVAARPARRSGDGRRDRRRVRPPRGRLLRPVRRPLARAAVLRARAPVPRARPPGGVPAVAASDRRPRRCLAA